MKKLNTAIAAIAALFITSGAASASNGVDLQSIVNDYNVSLNENCSGTFISEDLILTANHCVESQYRVITVQKVDDKTGEVREIKKRIQVPGRAIKIWYRGAQSGLETSRTSMIYELVDTDSDVDLALLRTSEKLPGGGIPIGCDTPQVMDKVFAMGNPFGTLFNTITNGFVSSLRRSYRDLGIEPPNGGDDKHSFVQHTAAIAPGSSGGALLDDHGNLIGVNVRGASQGAFYLSVPTQDIIKFLAENDFKICGETK